MASPKRRKMPLSNKTKVFIFFGILLLAFLYLNVKDPYTVNPESVLVKPSIIFLGQTTWDVIFIVE